MAPTKRASKQPGVQRHVAKAPRGTASTPAVKSDLYAWAVPAFSTGSPVDHTWVTTYDNRVKVYSSDQQVAAAGESYWYCWGSFHPTAGTPNNSAGFLGQQNGDLVLAKCLVAPNADSQTVAAARGTIFTYGIDGVCHQLANQVLYATGIGAAAPLTVRNARGYIASTFLYGTYGVQHAAWANEIGRCGGQPIQAPPGGAVVTAARGAPVAGPPDDFEAHARKVLAGEDPKLLADLLALRTDVLRFNAQRWPGFTAPDANTLNARNQHLLDQAAKLLGPERFQAIFGFSPDQKINLVDPTIKQP